MSNVERTGVGESLQDAPEISLVTADGALVAKLKDLAFTLFASKPDVLFWGSRVFIRQEDYIYREAFAYSLVAAIQVMGPDA